MEVTIDIGKSGSRTRLHETPGGLPGSSSAPVEVEGPGIDPSTAGRPDGAARVARVVREAVASAAAQVPGGQITSIVVASTAVPADARPVADGLAERFPAARIAMFTDHTAAHAAVLGEPGVAATVGTGVGVTALSRQGAITRVDGWGPDLGDRGSAWQIGREALRAGFAAHDGVGEATALEEAARIFCGGMELADAVRLLAAEDWVARIAGFAPTVCALDDPVARGIVSTAAEDLLASLASAAIRSGTTTVACRGRLLLNDRFRNLLEEGCRLRGWEFRRPRGDILDVDHDLLFAEPYRRHALALRWRPGR